MGDLMGQLLFSVICCLLALGLLRLLSGVPTNLKLWTSIAPLFALFVPVEWLVIRQRTVGEPLDYSIHQNLI
jgi:hypothetical protein